MEPPADLAADPAPAGDLAEVAEVAASAEEPSVSPSSSVTGLRRSLTDSSSSSLSSRPRTGSRPPRMISWPSSRRRQTLCPPDDRNLSARRPPWSPGNRRKRRPSTSVTRATRMSAPPWIRSLPRSASPRSANWKRRWLTSGQPGWPRYRKRKNAERECLRSQIAQERSDWDEIRIRAARRPETTAGRAGAAEGGRFRTAERTAGPASRARQQRARSRRASGSYQAPVAAPQREPR